MASLNAFVGHSFRDEDKEVVQAFLEYLTTISDSQPDFKWTHAQATHPQEISKKVLQLIEGKNLFIGICTRNELATSPDHLNLPMLSKQRIVKEEHLIYKTSDWIIQEIGMAIGRKMHLILLQEDGVRVPGGLQGDMEYISFSRERPERAFRQISEMLASLKQDGEPKAIRDDSTESHTAVQAIQDKEPSEASPEPDKTWDHKEFEFRYLLATISDDDERAEKIRNAYAEINGGAPELDLDRWNAFCLMIKISHEKGGSIDQLKAIQTRHSEDSEIASCLAAAYHKYDQHAETLKYLRLAVDNEPSATRKITHLTRIAQVEDKRADKSGNSEVLSEMRQQVSDESSEVDFLRGAADLPRVADHWHLKAAALERLMQLRPDDHSNRFSLAYFYSEHEQSTLSAYHYEKVPGAEKSGVLWNNLGVALRNMNLPALSVDAYSAAVEADETLAMSNLAEIYLREGLVSHAEELISRAEKIQSPHKNVAGVRVKINSFKSDEEDRKKKAIDRSAEVRQFLALAGRNFTNSEKVVIEGEWIGSNWSLLIKIDGTNVSGEGEEVVPANALGDSEKKEDRRYQLAFSGSLEGGVVRGSRSRKPKGSGMNSLFALGSPDKTFTMTIDPDKERLLCMCDADIFTLQRPS